MLGPEAAETMAAKVGETYGAFLATRMGPTDGGRSVRAAMHTIAETLTAHGFAAHAEDRETSTQCGRAVPVRGRGDRPPVLCAVDRGMVKAFCRACATRISLSPSC